VNEPIILTDWDNFDLLLNY